MKLNRRHFLAGLSAVGATVSLPVALADATPDQISTAWKQLLKAPWYFDVTEFEDPSNKERYLSKEEAQSLYRALQASVNTMLQYIIPMLILTGAHKAEVLNAK